MLSEFLQLLIAPWKDFTLDWVSRCSADSGGEYALSASSEGGEEDIEEQALRMAVEEIYQESGQRFKPWAHNAKALRMGDVILILLITSSRDCFRDVARELAECPEVAIIQHESDVMQVAHWHHYFENGIAHFTRRINKCISMACANGEVAPFVGHNAFLRWSALQDAAFEDSGDDNKMCPRTSTWPCVFRSVSSGRAKYCLSDHRVQLEGYIIRWSTYSEGGFKEGISLTCDDELNRWQKYS
ncbi:glycosyl transferase family group 2-domain-containing protein [Lactifluus subvellereus]|nr:glycosyl transferase family group 2-domain-containing protein [Lactifluus subvellereus]